MMQMFRFREGFMTDNPDNPAGRQLDTQALRRRQRKAGEATTLCPAPVVIVNGLRTPENIGSILRHCDAAGCKQVVLVDCDYDAQSKKITRIARSSDQHLHIEALSKREFIERITEWPPLIAIEITTASRDLYASALPEQCGLLVGSERHGIDGELLSLCAAAVHIPMYGINGSMNVSHALTLALYEWRRQRGG